MPILQGSSDDSAGVSRDEPSQSSSEDSRLEPECMALASCDGVGASPFRAELADEVGEQIEILVGDADADRSINAGLHRLARSVQESAHEVVLVGGLQLLKHSDCADDGLADGPCRLDAFCVLFALERSAVYSPAVGVADLVALGLDAAALDVFDLAVAHAAEKGDRYVAGGLQVACEGGKAGWQRVVDGDRLDPGAAVQGALDGFVDEGGIRNADDSGDCVDGLAAFADFSAVAFQRSGELTDVDLALMAGQGPSCRDVVVKKSL